MRATHLVLSLVLLAAAACGGETSGIEEAPITTNEADASTSNDTENDRQERTDENPQDETPEAPDQPVDTPVDETPTTDPSNPDAGEDDVPVAATGGCGQAAPSTGDHWELEHDGMDREYRVHLPRGYDPAVPTPVVFNFHGRSMRASQQALLTGMNSVADEHGFIVVYPEGTGTLEQTFNGGLCCGSAQTRRVDDVGFTSAIIDDISSKLCVDEARVYATGMSNGGFMAHRVACELSDRIAAISAVAGVLGLFDCDPDRPVPVLHMHGDADSVVSYDGYAGFVGVPSTMSTWADVDGCSSNSTVYFDEDDVVCEEWTGCDAGAEVKLCTIEGGGHTWPGGSDILGVLGKTTQTISASEESWRFFERHSLP